MAAIYQDSFDTETRIDNLPLGKEIIVQTDADLQIAFWNPAKANYGAATTVTAPGAVIICPNDTAKLTASGTANVNIQPVA